MIKYTITQNLKFTATFPLEGIFVIATVTPISQKSVLDDDRYKVEIQSEITKDLPDGIFYYQYITEDSVLEEGELEVKANYLINPKASNTERWKKALEAIDDAILKGRTSGVSSVTVDGKAIVYTSTSELLALRKFFKDKLDEELGKHRSSDESRIEYKFKLR